MMVLNFSEQYADLKVVALAGGVGGARMANGLSKLLSPNQFSVIVNTADDFIHWGLQICPDLDTVMYTMAGLSNPAVGWGLENESFNCLAAMQRLGMPDWFKIGDQDLAVHLTRSHWLNSGLNLTKVTEKLAKALQVEHTILPMSDQPCRTIAITDQGEMDFQTYFVKNQWQPVLHGLRWECDQDIQATGQVLETLKEADLIILCPSNPFVSIDPILNLPGIHEILKRIYTVAISPIIGGKAVKGPAAKMFPELFHQPASVSAVAEYYLTKKILNGFIIDQQDREKITSLKAKGLDLLATDSLMLDTENQVRVAREILNHFAALV
jgi:LPPG:FO 2-phospho-L-lactate transferase